MGMYNRPIVLEFLLKLFAWVHLGSQSHAMSTLNIKLCLALQTRAYKALSKPGFHRTLVVQPATGSFLHYYWPQTCNEVVYISMYITVHTLNYEKNSKNISIYPIF
jgi:hypothetical protein